MLQFALMGGEFKLENNELITNLNIVKDRLFEIEALNNKLINKKIEYENINNKLLALESEKASWEGKRLIADGEIKRASNNDIIKRKITKRKIITYLLMSLGTTVLAFYILLIIFALVPDLEKAISNTLHMHYALVDMLLSLILGFSIPILILFLGNKRDDNRNKKVTDKCMDAYIKENNDKSLEALENLNSINNSINELQEILDPINIELKAIREEINKATVIINNILMQYSKIITKDNIDIIISYINNNEATSLKMAVELYKAQKKS